MLTDHILSTPRTLPFRHNDQADPTKTATRFLVELSTWLRKVRYVSSSPICSAEVVIHFFPLLDTT
jgi:hypothetical protein